MQALMSLLYFLLFVLFISTLIVIHELGHLAMAKAFKVYCFEFSIGMGPAFFSKKRKKGETKFSLRAIPFGGYVSMYDSDAPLPEGLKVDPSRALTGIKKWKKAIIFVAGVVMNCFTALVIFFVSAWIPQQKFAPNAFNIDHETAIAIGCNEGSFSYEVKELANGVYQIDDQVVVHYESGDTQINVVAALNYNDFSFKRLNVSDYLGFYTPSTSKDEEGNDYTVISKDGEINISQVDYIEFSFNVLSRNANDEVVKTELPLTVHKYFDDKKQQYFYDNTGLKIYTITERCKGFGQAIGSTFKDFGDGATIVFTSLKTLLTDTSSWSQAGGIIAVGFTTSNTLQNLGWSYFLYYWGVISVNLAILNILPFPGLDGWHLLVIIVEGITRKPIPPKVKNIVALIGMSLLFLLMIVLLFKDVFKFIFNIGLCLL